MIKSVTKLTVQFNDLDPMNIVWHGNYLKYLEQARSEFFINLGYDYMKMYEDGVAYPIVKLDLKFIASATFNQNLEILCVLKEIEPAIIISYTIFDAETNDKILIAKSMQIGLDVKTKETLYVPPERLLAKIKAYKEDFK